MGKKLLKRILGISTIIICISGFIFIMAPDNQTFLSGLLILGSVILGMGLLILLGIFLTWCFT